ncbi:MAG: ATP-dependent 6-phosphofructokinase [Planctomycetes bacterium]|nr:ATP-dependent 6-phosphofructokinase [Planctomycetota bacterium]
MATRRNRTAERARAAAITSVGVLAGGGDAPGMNAVIRAVVRTALGLGWKVHGIRNGFEGLLSPDGVQPLEVESIRGILPQGGSILGASGRANPFELPETERGKTGTRDASERVLARVRELGLDALVVLGGQRTFRIAHRLAEKGLPLVGVPKTISNDVEETVITFGFDTAVATATDALDRLHTTAKSHERVMVVEVTGRETGWIALHAGIAGGADAILIPEVPFDLETICRKVDARYRERRNFAIIVAAEGATPKSGKLLSVGPPEAGRDLRLGGIGAWLAEQLERRTGREARSLALGHLLRGGSPTTFDRLLGTRLGAAAVRLLAAGVLGHMVALRPPQVVSVPLARAAESLRRVPLDGDTVLSARALGISFGDEGVH